MTKDRIRQLDVRVRQHMLVNGLLSKKEVEDALAERDDLPDLAEKMIPCSTPDPSEDEEEVDKE